MNTSPYVYCTSLDNIQAIVPSIDTTIQEHGYCVIRGVYDRADLDRSVDLNRHKLSQSQLIHPSSCSSDVVRCNSVKWSIGSTSKTQGGISRFMMTIMNPMWCEDIYKMRSHFTSLIIVRDAIARRSPMLDDQLPETLFNGTRIQYYPSGGGFMSAHTDATGEKTASLIHGEYIQLVLLLTQKGTHFENGGAYILRDDSFIDVERYSQTGDILVYNSSIIHGVSDIDPQIPYDPSTINGRLVALATIYN